MYKTFYFLLIMTIIPLLGGIVLCCRPVTPNNPDLPTPLDPANASYSIENDRVQLANGRAEWQAAPGSASKVLVAVTGKTVYGDLNQNGKNDAVLFLTYSGSGSGTFFYLAAALQKSGQFNGTNGIFLGDRIGVPFATVQNGLVIVEYLDRNRDVPMAAEPSVLRTRYFNMAGTTLQEIKPAADEAVYQGWLTIGHEVRSFLPCNDKDDLWLLGNSPALAEIIASHKQTTFNFPPYSPVFVILTGRKAASPAEGFGADHRGAFAASQLVHTWPKGNCKSDLIILDSPMPGAIISSPLAITGRARGTWFFEGDFPVILEDGQSSNIAVSYATAKGEWMTTDFVDFKSVLEFNRPLSGRRGTLILKKDNPTGQAEFDDTLKIPVNFY